MGLPVDWALWKAPTNVPSTCRGEWDGIGLENIGRTGQHLIQLLLRVQLQSNGVPSLPQLACNLFCIASGPGRGGRRKVVYCMEP